MLRSHRHPLTPILILWACTVTAQKPAQHSSVPSPDNPQTEIEHASFPTEEPLAGSTRIETNVVLNTVSSVESLSEPKAAEIVVVPSAKTLAKPWLPPALLIVATAGLLLLHVAVVVKSCLLPSVISERTARRP